MPEPWVLFESTSYSGLAEHDSGCCLRAKLWVELLDCGERESVHDAPSWIRKRYEWGPSKWPMFWCDAVVQKELDCGALAALSRHAISSRGIASAPVQLIEVFPEENCDNWLAVWDEATVDRSWITAPYVYHEAVGILSTDSWRLYDPTDDVWIDDWSHRGYGTVVAARFVDTDAVPVAPVIGGIRFNWNIWVPVEQ